MKKNMGTADRLIRILVAVIAVVLFVTDIVSGTAGIIMLAVAGVFLLTSFAGFCPLYVPFRISTRKKQA